MNFIIHIGWHKTGSTSLQVFLLKNRKALIRECQTYYPREGLLTCAHHTVAWSFQGRETSPWGPVALLEGGGDAYVRAAMESANAKACTTIVLSSEEFCTFDLDAIQSLSKSLRAMADSVQIVAYIRRQDLLVESAYNMQVKWWGARLRADFDEYVKDKRAYPNYFRVLKGWVGVFGVNNLIVRRYERDALESRDIRIDFCTAVGLNHEALDHMEDGVNDSLGPRTLEFLRILNNLDVSRDEHERIATRLLSYDMENQSPKCVLFGPDQRRAYMAPFEMGNRKLAQFGVDPEPLMVGGDSVRTRNVRRLTRGEFAEMLAYVSPSG